MSWNLANRRLVATAIGELSYEQLLRPARADAGPESKPGPYVLEAGPARYEFEAWRTAWDHLRVKASSLRRVENGVTDREVLAARFFLDTREATGMDDITLGNFFEEMHNTLYSESRLLENQPRAEALALMPGGRVQSFLSGHPKLLLNKGRLGWNTADLAAFSPESEAVFRLRWLAVPKDRALAGFASEIDSWKLADESLDAGEKTRLLAAAAAAGVDRDFHLLPVHPWQWERFIRIQFAGELASGNLRDLGVFGDLYRAQISLRTLTNVSRPGKMDVKLPVTILNTSAFRGIPAKYVDIAPALSHAVADLCRHDDVLKNVEVLEERGGVCLPQPSFAAVKNAPYRYHELLGALWRQSAESKLGDREDAVMTGALFHQDSEGRSYAGALIARSGLSHEQWLKLYFDHVVVPLYHLQVKHGLGLVAHGQNVVLKLRDHRPCGLLIKDFQGDLRLSTEETDFIRGLGPLTAALTRLPPPYLIHDLVTGHFVTVLRFVSGALRESDGFPEERFHRLLAASLRAYVEAHPDLVTGGARDLFAPTFARVILNKVRFKIGYGDSAERPLPLLGDDLDNPLFPFARESEATHV